MPRITGSLPKHAQWPPLSPPTRGTRKTPDQAPPHVNTARDQPTREPIAKLKPLSALPTEPRASKPAKSVNLSQVRSAPFTMTKPRRPPGNSASKTNQETHSPPNAQVHQPNPRTAKLQPPQGQHPSGRRHRGPKGHHKPSHPSVHGIRPQHPHQGPHQGRPKLPQDRC